MTPLDVINLVRRLLDLVLDLVPAEAAKQMLDDASVRRANEKADAAERLKFGPEKP